MTVGCISALILSFVGVKTAYHALVDSVINLGHTAFVVENVEAEEVVVEVPWKEEVMGMLKDFGISTVVAERVIQCESNWKPHAKNKNRNGSNDLGIWQLNSIHGIPDHERLDPVQATWHAIRLIKKSGWQNWVCYNKIYGK